LKDTELKLIAELMKNSRRSDRELAKTIGISQPTVSRIRTRLEKEGVVRYTGAADLTKLGYEIIAMTFGRTTLEGPLEARVKKAKDFLAKHPNIIFFSTGRGSKSDKVAISVHKDYSDYSNFIHEIRSNWMEQITIADSFLIALGSDNVLKPISLAN
jgi:DNA-binding Lrp family transcriptional regulator